MAVARAVLLDLGVEGFDEQQFWLYKRGGKTTHESLQLLGFPEELAFQATSAWFDRIEETAWLALDHAFPPAKGALKRVRRAGFEPVIISARRCEEAARCELSALGLADCVGEFVVVAPTNAWAHKADALSRMNAVGFIGDAETDALAAAKAGVPFAAVCGGQRDEVFLRGQGITAIYATVDKATEALLSTIRERRRPPQGPVWDGASPLSEV